MSETSVRQFIGRCARFMQANGLLHDTLENEACDRVAARLNPLRRLGLQSEQAITFAIAVELRCGRALPSDQRLADGLTRLPEDQAIRIDWLKTYLETSPEWSV